MESHHFFVLHPARSDVLDFPVCEIRAKTNCSSRDIFLQYIFFVQGLYDLFFFYPKSFVLFDFGLLVVASSFYLLISLRCKIVFSNFFLHINHFLPVFLLVKYINFNFYLQLLLKNTLLQYEKIIDTIK